MASKETIVNPREKTVAQLRQNHFVEGVLADGVFGSDHCTVTDKRLYYKGRTLTMAGGVTKAKTEAIINLESIHGTSFYSVKSVLLLVLGVLLALSGVLGIVLENVDILDSIMGEDARNVGITACLVLGAVMFLAYFASLKKIIQITYCGAQLSMVCTRGCTEQTMRAFCNTVQAAAEQARKSTLQETETDPV